MKIAFTAEHSAFDTYWSTPIGIKIALQKLGHEAIDFGYHPDDCNLEDIIKRQDEFDFVLVFSCGPHPSLDSELGRLKCNISKKILLELGDEPQTQWMNATRVLIADAVFTPDKNCAVQYRERGINAHWLTHWGDEYIFEYDGSIPRENKCVTTCGDRGLELIEKNLGDLFVNKRISPEENRSFYNSGSICLQRSRFNEITRRIFEAGGCKLAVVTDFLPHTGLSDIFIHNEDILYYSSIEQAYEYIKLLLEDNDLRNSLANNIYHKINKYHRAITRAQEIINIYLSIRR